MTGDIAAFKKEGRFTPTPIEPIARGLHRFEMTRTPDGNFTGTMADPHGWIVTIRAGIVTHEDGSRGFRGYGWLTAGPPEAGQFDPNDPTEKS